MNDTLCRGVWGGKAMGAGLSASARVSPVMVCPVTPKGRWCRVCPSGWGNGQVLVLATDRGVNPDRTTKKTMRTRHTDFDRRPPRTPSETRACKHISHTNPTEVQDASARLRCVSLRGTQ